MPGYTNKNATAFWPVQGTGKEQENATLTHFYLHKDTLLSQVGQSAVSMQSTGK